MPNILFERIKANYEANKKKRKFKINPKVIYQLNKITTKGSGGAFTYKHIYTSTYKYHIKSKTYMDLYIDV